MHRGANLSLFMFCTFQEKKKNAQNLEREKKSLAYLLSVVDI